MTDTKLYPTPSHWIVESGHFLGGLPVSADEMSAISSRLNVFWTVPGSFSVVAEFEEGEDPMGYVKVEYEGPDRVVSELYLVMTGIFDDINGDRIIERKKAMLSQLLAPDTSVPPQGLVDRLSFLR
jgi:hypothetical protein